LKADKDITPAKITHLEERLPNTLQAWNNVKNNETKYGRCYKEPSP